MIYVHIDKRGNICRMRAITTKGTSGRKNCICNWRIWRASCAWNIEPDCKTKISYLRKRDGNTMNTGLIDPNSIIIFDNVAIILLLISLFYHRKRWKKSKVIISIFDEFIRCNIRFFLYYSLYFREKNYNQNYVKIVSNDNCSNL